VLISGEVPLSMARSGLISARIGQLSGKGIAWQPVIAASLCASARLSGSRGTSGLYDFMMRLTSSTNLILYIGVHCRAAVRHQQMAGRRGAAVLVRDAVGFGAGSGAMEWPACWPPSAPPHQTAGPPSSG
jgi:hypothetical protein